MDWLTFFSNVISAVAWPGVVLFIFCTLWWYFPKLAPFVRQLKYGDMEVNFGQRLEAAAEASAALVDDSGTAASAAIQDSALQSQPNLTGPPESDQDLKPSVTQAAGGDETDHGAATQAKKAVDFDWVSDALRHDVKDSPEMDSMRRLAEISPRSAFAQSWGGVEYACLNFLKETKFDRRVLTSAESVYRAVEQSGYLSSSEQLLLRNVWALYNDGNSRGTRLTFEEALKFSEVAQNLRRVIMLRTGFMRKDSPRQIVN
jgi:hypothetical protein